MYAIDALLQGESGPNVDSVGLCSRFTLQLLLKIKCSSTPSVPLVPPVRKCAVPLVDLFLNTL